MPASEQTLVVMFVDISGSTRLFSEHGNQRALALTSACITDLRSIIDHQNGTVVQTFGDGVLCTFPTADAAFKAAIEFRTAQRNHGVSIHAGFHYGLVIVKDDSIYGDAVNIASRLADKAKKEEIILSEDVMVKLSPTHSKSTRSLRNPVFVKGKNEPMRLYKIVSESEDEATAFMNNLDISTLQAIQLELIYQDQVVMLNELESDCVLGRSDTCDLIVQHSYASRGHATIDCKPGKFTLVDHSSNGSYVRDEYDQLISVSRDSLQLYGSGAISLGVEPERNPEHLIQFRIFKSASLS